MKVPTINTIRTVCDRVYRADELSRILFIYNVPTYNIEVGNYVDTDTFLYIILSLCIVNM